MSTRGIASTSKLINNVVCTTTLMQGVNLPAQNVILRNPNLYLQKKEHSQKLTQYEISNLRGRAGRLLKDFIGRTFVLDENAFGDNEEGGAPLFEDNYKKISSGYGDVFQNYKKDITADLVENEPCNKDNKSYHFLLSYIRQMILRHKENAESRFISVGIKLSKSELADISKSLSELTIPVEICGKNRYWDPIDLEKMYLNKNNILLPTSVREQGIANKLQTMIEWFQEFFPQYTARYFKIDNPKLLQATCISAESWLKEKSLKQILSHKYYDDDAEKIEDTIDRLQNRVSYGLPMLLKPLYDIKQPDKSFLTYIEAGAFRPVTRRLIEYNIPRETAIYLQKNYLSELNSEENFDVALKEILYANFNSFEYWVQIQLEALVSSNPI